MKNPQLPSLILSTVLLLPATVWATATPSAAHRSAVAQQSGQTADQQSNDKADLALVQKIRAAIVKDKTLSTAAHNCKVITAQGAVTLRGEVKSDSERAAVEKIATAIAGEGKVTNELTVAKARQ
jgi:osmotically-inducible protein OsmY